MSASRRVRRRVQRHGEAGLRQDLHRLARAMVRAEADCPLCDAPRVAEEGCVMWCHEPECPLGQLGTLSVKL